MLELFPGEPLKAQEMDDSSDCTGIYSAEKHEAKIKEHHEFHNDIASNILKRAWRTLSLHIASYYNYSYSVFYLGKIMVRDIL